MSVFHGHHRGERLRPLMRVSLLLLTAVLAIMLLGTSAIEAQTPSHKFYGFGSLSTVSGEVLRDGSIVYAWNETDELVSTGVVRNGLWDLDVDAASANAVRFSINDSDRSGWHDVSAGALTELSLSLTGPLGGLNGGTSVSPLSERDGFERYIIQAGDTLAGIADRLDLHLALIVADNPQFANPGAIRVGDPLYLRQGSLPAVSASAEASPGATGSDSGVASTPPTTAASEASPSAATPAGGAAGTDFVLLPREDSDTWAWLAIGTSIAAMVVGLGGLMVARRRRLQAERRELAHAAMPAALAPDLTPPPLYRTLVGDRAPATFAGPFDTTSPQTEAAGQPETFGGGD